MIIGCDRIQAGLLICWAAWSSSKIRDLLHWENRREIGDLFPERDRKQIGNSRFGERLAGWQEKGSHKDEVLLIGLDLKYS